MHFRVKLRTSIMWKATLACPTIKAKLIILLAAYAILNKGAEVAAQLLQVYFALAPRVAHA